METNVFQSSLWVIMVFPRSLKDCFKEVLNVFQGNFNGVSRKFERDFKGFSSFKGVSMKMEGYLKEVSREF